MARATATAEKLYPTKNDLRESTRTQVCALLNRRLADAVDLQGQAKQAHWNVKGPNFIALHELFDKVYEAVEEYVDLIAERIVQLGGVAEGTTRIVAERSGLDEYPLSMASGTEHVKCMAAALSAFGSRMRIAINECDELEDAVSADMCTEIARGVDKWLWFIEAHVQGRA